MIKTTIEEILKSADVLNDLVARQLKAKTAYHVARLAREVNREAQLFEEERTKLVEKYAEKDENNKLKIGENGNISVAKENLENYVKEITELTKSEIELNVEPLELSDLGEEDFTAQQMENLMTFIKE